MEVNCWYQIGVRRTADKTIVVANSAFARAEVLGGRQTETGLVSS